MKWLLIVTTASRFFAPESWSIHGPNIEKSVESVSITQWENQKECIKALQAVRSARLTNNMNTKCVEVKK